MIIIDDNLLARVRQAGACAHCHKRRPLDPHHLFGRGAAGGKRLDVRFLLVAVCRPCHDRAAELHPFLLAVVARRFGVTVADIEDAARVLRQLPRRPTPHDAAMACAGLRFEVWYLVDLALKEAPHES